MTRAVLTSARGAALRPRRARASSTTGRATWSRTTTSSTGRRPSRSASRTARRVRGDVVGTDPSSILAVFKVGAPASLLHPLALADSSQIVVGQDVVAIGSPFGLEGTSRVGSSARASPADDVAERLRIDDSIQTDAAINHGTSGGPLLDLERPRDRSQRADRERLGRQRRRRLRGSRRTPSLCRLSAARGRRGALRLPRRVSGLRLDVDGLPRPPVRGSRRFAQGHAGSGPGCRRPTWSWRWTARRSRPETSCRA